MKKLELIYFYSNVFFVEGVNKCLIIDTFNEDTYSVPNDNRIICRKLKNIYVCVELKKMLISKNLAYTQFDPNLDVEIDLKYEYPAEISNSILELDTKSNLELFKKSIRQLIELGCFNIELRIWDIDEEKLYEILKIVEKSDLYNITIHLSNFTFTYEIDVQLKKLKKLTHAYLYSCKNAVAFDKFTLIKNKFDNKFCGFISVNNFTTNLISFKENQKFNSCLNKKISIDTEGNIKLCPSIDFSYGNIKNVDLKQVLIDQKLKKYWNSGKDKIKVCQDCEFRYICTDCRAYIEDPKDIYSKPLKCGYDPYTGEWSEWSTNPLKQKAIKYYGMEELVKKDE